MASRPYLNLKGQNLVELFQSSNNEKKALIALRAELVHRNTPSMRDLRSKVEAALANGKEPAPKSYDVTAARRADQSEPFQHSVILVEKLEQPRILSPSIERGSEVYSVEDDEEHPTIADKGRLGSIRPCGVVPGVPSRWTFPDKRDFELEIGKDAARIEKFVVALRALVKDMRRNGSGMRTITLEQGKSVPLDGRERGYRFQYDGDAELFEGAKVTIVIGSRTCDGRIVSISSEGIIISSEDDIGDNINTCVLRIDNTAMIDVLADCLEKVRIGAVKANLLLADDVFDNCVESVWGEPLQSERDSYKRLNAQQKKVVDHVMVNSVTYLWGPPGTGKTYSLSAINELLLNEGKRILICSNTNQAVDQVLSTLCRTLKTSHPIIDAGKVLRIGKTEGLGEHAEFLTLDGIVKRKSTDLQKKKLHLESKIQVSRATSEAARRILSDFQAFDEAQSQVSQLAHERTSLGRSVSNAVDAEQKASNLVESRDNELKEWLKAGLVRRLILKPEYTIRGELVAAQANRDKITRQLHEHQLALDNPQHHQKEGELALRVKSLSINLRNQDRTASQKQVDEAEMKITEELRELAEINRALGDIEKTVLAESRIIGATVTKTYLSPQLFGNFDVVIIDEASMVMLPAVYYVSGLAKEKVVVSGDFRQLSPIVPTQQTAIQEVIGLNVFESAKIDGEGGNPKRTIMLIEQYRMQDSICRLVSDRIYKGKLTTARQDKVSSGPPSPFDGDITIIDTSPIQPFVNRHGSSRYNLMNAMTIRNLVRHFRECGFLGSTHETISKEQPLGICTPFAAQKDLIKRLVVEDGVIVGTVHRYQGDEKVAMVIDIPDSLGERYVSLFAQAESLKEAGTKLFNVAVTRTKRHLIFVANLNYLDAKLPANAFLRDLLYTASTKGRVVDVRDVLDKWPIMEDLKRIGRSFSLNPEALQSGLFRQSDFEVVCGADIEQAKKGVAIYSGFVTPQRVASYELLFRKKVSEGVAIRCITRPPKRNGSIPEELGRDSLNGLESMGCVVDTRWAIHEKVVIIDDEIIWFGSLNPLSHTNRTDEMMARITGRDAALQLSAFMAVTGRVNPDKAQGLAVIAENPRCPDCGHRSTYCVGSYGPFWQCEDACGWRQSVAKANSAPEQSKSPPKEGPPCPVCGAKTTSRKGPYKSFYGCSSYPRCTGIVKEVQRSRSKSRGKK